MEGPESQRPADPVEAPKADEGQQGERPEKPLDEMVNEHKKAHERQQEHAAQEKPEHAQREQTAESMLDQEINSEIFEEMANALSGDAKEVFEAVKGQLSPQERADIGSIMKEFQDFSDTKFSEAIGKTGEATTEEAAARLKATQGRRLAETFQNSIDNILRKAQEIKKDDPRTEQERFNEELNERNNQEFQPKSNKDSWNKLWDLSEAYVKEAKAKEPNRVFKGKDDKPAVEGPSSVRLSRFADALTAETLMNEVKNMKADGVGVTLKTGDGKTEITDLQKLMNEKQVQLEVGMPQGMNAAKVEKAMVAEGAIRTVNLGDRQLFSGTPDQIREGLQDLAREAEKAKKAEK